MWLRNVLTECNVAGGMKKCRNAVTIVLEKLEDIICKGMMKDVICALLLDYVEEILCNIVHYSF